MYLEHRAVLFREVREERGDVAGTNVSIEHQLAQRDGGDLLGEGGASKQWTGDVLGDRVGDGPADQVHPADRLDALLYLVVELEHEAEDVARIDEGDDDDVSRIGDLVVEDHLGDACSDELGRGAFRGSVRQFRLHNGAGQRPEFAVVVFQYLQVDEAVQGQIDNGLCTRRKSFDPVLGVVPDRFVCDLLQDGVQGRVAGLCPVHEEQGLHIRVDAAHEREFCEHGAGDGAVQVPARHLVKVTTLLVEEHEDELFGQTQGLGSHTLCGKRHQPWSPRVSRTLKPPLVNRTTKSMTLLTEGCQRGREAGFCSHPGAYQYERATLPARPGTRSATPPYTYVASTRSMSAWATLGPASCGTYLFGAPFTNPLLGSTGSLTGSPNPS